MERQARQLFDIHFFVIVAIIGVVESTDRLCIYNEFWETVPAIYHSFAEEELPGAQSWSLF